MPNYPERVSPSYPHSTEVVNEASDSIEELLEQIEIAEAELEEQKEMKLKFEQDEDEGFNHIDDLTEISIDIRATEQKLKQLRDQLPKLDVMLNPSQRKIYNELQNRFSL